MELLYSYLAISLFSEVTIAKISMSISIWYRQKTCSPLGLLHTGYQQKINRKSKSLDVKPFVVAGSKTSVCLPRFNCVVHHVQVQCLRLVTIYRWLLILHFFTCLFCDSLSLTYSFGALAYVGVDDG
jgi:hypothetical protein